MRLVQVDRQLLELKVKICFSFLMMAKDEALAESEIENTF